MDTDSASCTDAQKIFQYSNKKFPLFKEEKSSLFSKCVNFIYCLFIYIIFTLA